MSKLFFCKLFIVLVFLAGVGCGDNIFLVTDNDGYSDPVNHCMAISGYDPSFLKVTLNVTESGDLSGVEVLLLNFVDGYETSLSKYGNTYSLDQTDSIDPLELKYSQIVVISKSGDVLQEVEVTLTPVLQDIGACGNIYMAYLYEPVSIELNLSDIIK